jgi:SOS regulatory protein LexA
VGFGERLREAFDNAGTAEIARRLGVTYQAAKNYLEGRIPSAEKLIEIADSTHCSIHWLLTGEGPREISASRLPPGEAPVFFGEREHEIIARLGREAGRGFDEEVRELVLEALLARGLVINQVQGANLLFFGEHVPKLMPMRLRGEIAAGKPIDVFEQDETVLVPEDFVVRGRENLVLRVRGDSMEDEGIFEGDLIIGVEAVEANNGDMVIALIDGDQATVKRFYRERNQIRLEPRSSKHKPMYLSPERVRIQGIVRGIFRRTM